MEQHERLDALCEGPRRPFILELEERLSAVLRTAGFLQVHTPIILSRARLEKMGVFDGSIMEKQVFWIDSKRCLRPMLAPHLYEYMREVGRRAPPVRLFEVGPCFRRETGTTPRQRIHHAEPCGNGLARRYGPQCTSARTRRDGA
ncbi:MAG: hypothetical protein ACLTTU_08730 [Bilophila wadsworthia]